MMPPSLIGARADLLIEAVVIAEVLAIPILVRSVRAARQGRIRRHELLQLGLAITFAIATIALELDIRLQGGTQAFVAGGKYEGTRLLDAILYGHLAIAAVNAVLWSVFPVVSFRRRRAGLLPGPFSQLHRRLGRWALVTYGLTAASGLALYAVGFVA